MSTLKTFPNAPLPTAKDLKARKNLFVQLFRFAGLNLKMIAMINKGHHYESKNGGAQISLRTTIGLGPDLAVDL